VKELQDLTVVNGHAAYRPRGETGLEESIAAVTQILAHCRQEGWRKVIIDLRGYVGQQPPGVMGFYDMVKRLAVAADCQVKVAMMPPWPIQELDHFGVTVGRNACLHLQVFDSEERALAWLADPNSA
jgi:hypothetical protein